MILLSRATSTPCVYCTKICICNALCMLQTIAIVKQKHAVGSKVMMITLFKHLLTVVIHPSAQGRLLKTSFFIERGPQASLFVSSEMALNWRRGERWGKAVARARYSVLLTCIFYSLCTHKYRTWILTLDLSLTARYHLSLYHHH